MDALPCSRLDARELARRQIERLVPADLDEGVLPARGAARALQPAAAHAGRRMRPAWFCARGMPMPIGDGSGSSATGCRATTSCSRTSTS